MNTPGARRVLALAEDVKTDSDMLRVRLVKIEGDCREMAVPLVWLPKLRKATEEQRSNWRLVGRGVGIHWEDLDEDISVEGLLRS